jgi:hypothetical protein
MFLEPVVSCGECGTVLPEPPGLTPEQRVPCPECGSTSRSVSITVTAAVAVADAVEPLPQTRLREQGFSLRWLQLSEGGAWMLQVFDEGGHFRDGAMADDPEEALLAVAERLLPGSEPAE